MIGNKKKDRTTHSIKIVSFLFFSFLFFGMALSSVAGDIHQSDEYGGFIQTLNNNDTHFLNVTVVDEKGQAVQNAFVVVFEGTIVKTYGHTDTSGRISFSLPVSQYIVQVEKHKYDVTSAYVSLTENIDIQSTIELKQLSMFGIGIWITFPVIGLILIAIIYINRDSLKIGKWKEGRNWFGSSRKGTWTYIDRSTRTALYVLFSIILFLLLVIIVPFFESLRNMGYFYSILGFITFFLFVVQGINKNRFPAAIGFGRKDELAGNILIGITFGLFFIGLTSFISQLSFITAQDVNTIATLGMVIIVASFIEEAFHSGILAPTIAEKAGIVPSIFLTSVVFMLGHGYTYGWILFPLVIAFLFRMVATSIVLYKKSWVNVFIAHAMINALSTFTLYIMS